MRIAGLDLPEKKPIWTALTILYGVGPKNVVAILAKAKVKGSKRVHELDKDDVARITKVMEDYKIEGDLRREVAENIKRLREIGSYRGSRHSKGLPSRGQRTRTNARTKRGKRMTIGALKKEAATRVAANKTTQEKK
ncbi:MAG: 30S ribosomal protein S13 [Candidatus Curtissbacteria bacterium]|nr:30S ribosomal protein S13 [bacterium]MDZ4209836.1 30S ribosomal protein S13 [Candidatus Curtissbacteria bacterium]